MLQSKVITTGTTTDFTTPVQESIEFLNATSIVLENTGPNRIAYELATPATNKYGHINVGTQKTIVRNENTNETITFICRATSELVATWIGDEPTPIPTTIVVTLVRNGTTDFYTVRVVVTAEAAFVAAADKIDIFLTPTDGGAEADPEEFDLFYVSGTTNEKTFEATDVEFEDPDGVVGMEYDLDVTIEDASNTQLWYQVVSLIAS